MGNDKVIRVIQYGMGSIGSKIVRELLKKRGYQLVGAIDIAPEKAGKDVSEVAGLTEPLNLLVESDPARVLASTKADAVVQATGSHLPQIFSQLEEVVHRGINVVSTSEELVYPFRRHPELSSQLDQLARDRGVTVLGTGVNPGFVMDTLALVLSSVCLEVNRVRVERVIDVATRRYPFQKKVGAGLSPEEFPSAVAQRRIGHVGLHESLYLIAYGLGWTIEEIKEESKPILADTPLRTDYLEVSPGKVAGINQLAQGMSGGKEVLTLRFQAFIGAPKPHDTIEIEGTPPLQLSINGGIAGDAATVAMIINAIPRVVAAEPGLKTMVDLPLPHAALG